MSHRLGNQPKNFKRLRLWKNRSAKLLLYMIKINDLQTGESRDNCGLLLQWLQIYDKIDPLLDSDREVMILMDTAVSVGQSKIELSKLTDTTTYIRFSYIMYLFI